MKIFFFEISQTPTKPILPAWLRTLCQYDLCTNICLQAGHTVDAVRYVDDTGLQIAKLVSLKDQLVIPAQNVGEYLGHKYVEANLTCSEEQAESIKLQLEHNPVAKELVLPNLLEQKTIMERFGFPQNEIFWESDLIAAIPGTIAELQTRNQILDYSQQGGDTFLDLTDQGMKLVTLRGKSGYTYLAKMLTFARLNFSRYDLVLLQHIDEDGFPFRYVEKYLVDSGIKFLTLNSGRVQLPGISGSSRKGGWEKFTAAEILAQLADFNPADMRAGLRLYFMGKYEDMARITFDLDILKQEVLFAKKVREFLEAQSDSGKPIELVTPKAIKIENILRSSKILTEPSRLVKRYRELFSSANAALKKNSPTEAREFIYLLNTIRRLIHG